LRILIVEDDVVDAKLLEHLLSESSLHIENVRSVAYLGAALELLEREHFDIVLLDLGLPDSQGAESFAALQERAPTVPIVVLSGLDDEDVAINAVQKGVQDYLVKGKVDSNMLMRTVRYAVERKKAECELQSAEQRYHTIFENSAVAIMVVDQQERLISWNKFTTDLLGMGGEELCLKPVRSLYPEAEWKKIRAHNVRQKGMQHHLDTKMIRKDGKVIDVDISLSVLKDSQGNMAGSIGVIRDITARKRFEEALRGSEERFRQVVENAKEWVWEVDANGLYTYSSPVVEGILGYKPEEIVGKKHFYDLYHPEDRDELKSKTFEMFAKRESLHEFLNRNLHKSGQPVWLSTSGVPILDESQNLLGYRGVDIDVTERKRIHEILDRKQKNLELMFDAVPVGMLLVGEDLMVRRVNDAIRQMVRRAYTEIVNQPIGNALGCVNSAQAPGGCGHSPACQTCLLRRTVQSALNTDRPVEKIEMQPTYRVGGVEFRPWLSISAVRVMIDGHRHVVVVVNDITERKLAEQKLEETMEMKTQFVSTVSHELRTPLGCIKEGIGIVLDGIAGTINDKQRKFLDIAKRNVDRLAALINDVLDFQRLEAGKMRLNMQEGSISEVVTEAYRTMVSSARAKGIDFHLELEDNLPTARFDRDKIIQVLINLISNAIKFTPERGQIRIGARCHDEELVVQVSDTGMGIPKEALGKIFERFYRVHRPGKEVPGTGLGLAIVQKIVTKHGGRIDVESELDKGTTITVFLPIVSKCVADAPAREIDETVERTLVRD
jgi:two-component system sensor histidine kinase/response regulator